MRSGRPPRRHRLCPSRRHALGSCGRLRAGAVSRTEIGAVVAAHSGRPGLVAGVVPATVRSMRDLGAQHIEAWIGPHVCGRCYEVPAEMRAEVAATVPSATARPRGVPPQSISGQGLRAQLEELGVSVHDKSQCTKESTQLFSYRRDGDQAGRHAGLIRLWEAS